jgi:hypothetical protein
MTRLFFASFLAGCILTQVPTASIAPASDAWLQWGGPARNFVVDSPLDGADPFRHEAANGRSDVPDLKSAVTNDR